MATLQRANLGFPTAVGTSAAALVDNASGTTLVVAVMLFNSDSSPRVVKVYLVPNSAGALGAAGATNQMVEVTLAAKESLSVPLGDGYGFTMTGTHDSVQISADVASKVYAVAIGDKLG